jgi:hypothetical protein
MMKTLRFELAQWLPEENDGSGNIYIDWPAVHRQVDPDQLKWLDRQDIAECQMVVENKPNDLHHYLVVEIYSDRLATQYALMWAK